MCVCVCKFFCILILVYSEATDFSNLILIDNYIFLNAEVRIFFFAFYVKEIKIHSYFIIQNTIVPLASSVFSSRISLLTRRFTFHLALHERVSIDIQFLIRLAESRLNRGDLAVAKNFDARTIIHECQA